MHFSDFSLCADRTLVKRKLVPEEALGGCCQGEWTDPVGMILVPPFSGSFVGI